MQQAVKASDNKDYKKALEILKPLAEQGEAKAQVILGEMYLSGKGVPQDDKQAVKWWRLAAEQGEAAGQSTLGLMYRYGQGVPQDYVLAHMWFNLCGSSGHKDREILKQCVRNRKKVEKRMTPSQLEKAQEMARNWKPKK
jgi:TPR repeat protein